MSLSAVSADARRIIPCGVVARRKILRRRSVRFRLPFVEVGNLRTFAGRFRVAAFVAVCFMLRAMLLVARVAFVRVRFIEVQNLLVATRRAQRLAWQHLNRWRSAAVHRSGANRRFSMTVIVVFQVFEYVADVQEGVPIQADVHECGLHARQDSRYFSFVDAANKRELFFALNVDFD
jgi:hypothetical protein